MNRADVAARNARILAMGDAGHRACEITKALGFPNRWTVDNALKVHRPDRERRKYQRRPNKHSRLPLHGAHPPFAPLPARTLLDRK